MANDLIEKPIEYMTTAGDKIKLTMNMVKSYLVAGKPQLVTDQEIVYFINVCKARKLNPFIKDCYLIKYDNQPAAIITSVDYFRKNARKAPDCKGWSKGVVVTTADGTVRYSKGIVLDGEKVVGGWFRGQPEGWAEPFELEVNLNGYIKKKSDGSVTQFWKPEKQATMIAKVAEAQGLRTLWGEAASGMMTPEEVAVDDIDMRVDSSGSYATVANSADSSKKTEISSLTGDDNQSSAVSDSKTSYSDPQRANQSYSDPLLIDVKFTELIGRNAIHPKMAEFLEASAKTFNLSVIEIKEAASNTPVKFNNEFQAWLGVKERTEPATKRPQPTQPEDGAKAEKNLNKDFRSKWINLRKPGFSTYVYKHLDHFRHCKKELYQEARNKWIDHYPDAAWPLDPPPENSENPIGAETPSEATESTISETEGHDKGENENLPAGSSGIAESDFNTLIETDEWQELSMLQQKHPQAYATVTAGKMPKNLAEVVSVIDQIETIVDNEAEGIPAG